MNKLTLFSLVLLALGTSKSAFAGTEESTSSAGPDSKQFVLEKGKGTAVCDAYLSLLNATNFDRTPFCGRPDEGPVIGFTHLERHELSTDEIFTLFPRVYEFVRFDDQHHVERFFYPPTNSWVTSPTDKSGISQFEARRWMQVWTYDAPLDVENSNSPLRIAIWQGYGVTPNGTPCGASDDGRHPWDFPYSDQLAFVLAPDGNSIDENKTREVFGRTGSRGSPSGATRRSKRARRGFIPIADSIGLFEFDGRYYMEVEDKPLGQGSDLPPVRVLLRERGQTKEICSVLPKNVPSPEPRLVNPGPVPRIHIPATSPK